MVMCLVDIFINVRIRKRAVLHSIHTLHGGNRSPHQKNLQTQMFILMTTSICLFLMTTLPLAIYKITSPRQKDVSTSILTIVTVWADLGWLQSLNYAVNISLFLLQQYHLSLSLFSSVKLLQSLPYFEIIS